MAPQYEAISPVEPSKNNMLSSEDCEFCKEISEAGKNSKPPKLSSRGVVMLSASGVFFAGVSAVLAPFVFPGLRRFALPYIPASKAQMNNVMAALKGRSGTLIDIGSGDGRITLTAARHGFKAYGVELNYWLVLYSRWKAWRGGLLGQVYFFKKDLWKTDLSQYQNVVIFGVESMMQPLEEKLTSEMPSNTSVIACRFPLPSWHPILTIGEGVDTVWVYKVPQSLDEKRS